MWYLKEQEWLTVKAGTDTVDHAAHTTRMCQTPFFKEKQKVLTPGNLAEMSNLEVLCSRNRYMQAGIANYNFLQRVPNQILENCLQPLEVSENCCIHYQRAET